MNPIKLLPLSLLICLTLPLCGSPDRKKHSLSSKDKLATTAATLQAQQAKEVTQEVNGAVATKIAETKLAIEHARAEHAQTQLEGTREMVEVFREELEKIKKELEATKRMLQDAHKETEILKYELEVTKATLTETQEALAQK